MPIKRITPRANISDFVQNHVRNIEARVIRELCIIGEKCVNQARITEQKGRDYKDQSGNLRSSTGYVVVANGEIVQMSDFAPVGGATEGSDSGKAFARKLAAETPTGFALYVVAGMNYASYVSAKGYDVLDTSELLAERLFKELTGKIGK